MLRKMRYANRKPMVISTNMAVSLPFNIIVITGENIKAQKMTAIINALV
jgi:hypothetical protein